jgi:hypothetical protein
VGILPEKGLDDPLAHQAAVFVIGLREHENQLALAAPGDHISLTKPLGGNGGEIFHG